MGRNLLRNKKIGELTLRVEGEHLCWRYSESTLMGAPLSHFLHHCRDVIITSMIVERLVRKVDDNIVKFVSEGAGHESDAIKVNDYSVSFRTDMVG